MVYIYQKKIEGKSYFYLRISQRIYGKLVVKDIAYLGNDIKKVEKTDIKKNLKEDLKE